MINGRAASGFGLPKTQTCYPPVGIVYNPMPLPFLSGSTVLLKCKFRLVFRVFHHLETSPFGRELPLVFLRIEFASSSTRKRTKCWSARYRSCKR